MWTPACRAEERDSISLRGATGPSEGRNEASKTSELGSIPSGPALGSDAEGCCSALQAERLGALPSDSTQRWLPWDGAHLGMMLQAGSTPAASSLRVRCNRLHCGLPNRRIRIVPGRSHNPRLSCFDSKPGCHPGGPSLTLGRRTTTCSSGSTARCKRATVRIVTAARLYASAEDSKRSSKAHWVGSIPTGSPLPRSTSGEVIGFSSRIDGLDTHTRCPRLCWRIQGLCYERSLRRFDSFRRLHALAKGFGGDVPTVARRSSTLRGSATPRRRPATSALS